MDENETSPTIPNSRRSGFYIGERRCFICGETIPPGNLRQVWSHPHFSEAHPEWYNWHMEWARKFRKIMVYPLPGLLIVFFGSVYLKYYYPLLSIVVYFAIVQMMLLNHQQKFLSFRRAWQLREDDDQRTLP